MHEKHTEHANENRSGGSFIRIAFFGFLAILAALVLLPDGPFSESGPGMKLLALAIFLPAFAAMIGGMVLRGLERLEATKK